LVRKPNPKSEIRNQKSKMFTVYPSIDLRGGQVVRLRQGDPDQQTTYSDNPLAVAKKWAGEGATWLHMVNLDGAFGDAAGAKANRRALNDICCSVKMKIQFGGGLRNIDDVKAAFDSGADRVVLGTAAAENPELVADVLAQYGAERLAIGLDSREGMIVTRGWKQSTQMPASELGLLMREMGVVHALYTEVGRDGMIDDVKELLEYAPRGVAGVIVGRSLYEGTLSLKEAIELTT
jgi:phosphoribosylformimino-5-aminoimidazole carboxamide ribotide isomerase